MSFESTINHCTALLLTGLIVSAGCGERAKPDAESATDRAQESSQPLQSGEPIANPPDHLAHPPADPRAALAEALQAGLLSPDMSQNDKLRAVLKSAGVAEASQVLVFSKTSLQDRLISPTHPRAIYFSDDCYIGYVPGGLVEYGDADPDPEVGVGLFAIDPRADASAALTADNACLNCHGGSRTDNRPGFLIRSVFPDEQGFPITSAGSTLVGHDTPIKQRWGGWYVTGNHGSLRHLGNLTAVEADNGQTVLYDREQGANLTDLSPYFNTSLYLQQTSDIVALMVLEHQVQMHNLLTQGASVIHERIASAQSLAGYLGEPYDPATSETLQRVLHSYADRIVKHLLFCNEIALDEPIVGSPDFQQAFGANRRQDSAGRSLKDFDLQTRMFKYRCSYMVYSRAFDLMPQLLKDAVIAKLRSVLTGSDTDAAYAHLGLDERQAIEVILSDTTDWYRRSAP